MCCAFWSVVNGCPEKGSWVGLCAGTVSVGLCVEGDDVFEVSGVEGTFVVLLNDVGFGLVLFVGCQLDAMDDGMFTMSVIDMV